MLVRTLATMNSASNEVSSVAWQHRVFSRIPLRRTCYYEVRSQFGLGDVNLIHRMIERATEAIDAASPSAPNVIEGRFFRDPSEFSATKQVQR